MSTAQATPVRIAAAATPAAQAADDRALVAAALAGTTAGFEQLMRRHNRLLFRAVRGVLDSDADAQDAVQEAWLHAFTRLADFRGDAAVTTWLTRIAINTALDARRRQGRAPAVDAGIDATAEQPLEQTMAFSLPAQHAPESEAQRAEVRALLERAIDALPPMYRSVFMLRSVQEMSVDEAAHALGLSAELVRTRHLRARALLRDALGAQMEQGIAQTFAFDGARCDRIVRAVLDRLDARRRLGLADCPQNKPG